MSSRIAKVLTAALLAALFIGTLMPGYWKETALRTFDAPVNVTAIAHVAIFAMLAFVVPFARFGWMRPWHVPLMALALAVLTEGLQFFAIDRHPNLAGVAQDMTGALMGWLLGLRFSRVPAA